RQRKYLLTGWFWYLGMLVPVIGLVQVGMQSMADRYMYLPSVGLFIFIAWGSAEISGRIARPQLIAVSAVAAIGICAFLTTRQLDYWRSSETLFKRGIAVTHDNYLAYNNLGFHFGLQDELEQAKECFQAAAKINPNSYNAWDDLAVILAMQRKTSE